MDTRQELADNHGENFADEFDQEFDMDQDDTEYGMAIQSRPSIRRQLLTILSSTAVFYVVGLADGVLIAMAAMRYFGG
jgi:hypothetical protein